MSSVLEQYIQEISEELKLNQFNIKERQLQLPARKHFWVARLVNTKIKANKLKSQKKHRKQDMVEKILRNAPVKMSLTGAQNAAENSKELKDLTEEIFELDMIIEYLEKVEKIMSTVHWEIKNIVELQQMEMQ